MTKRRKNIFHAVKTWMKVVILVQYQNLTETNVAMNKIQFLAQKFNYLALGRRVFKHAVRLCSVNNSHVSNN